MTKFYHGTNAEGINGILSGRKIGHNYFDGVGFYLADCPFWANEHGQYVLAFNNIDESKLETDDTNDGYFYRGFLSIDNISEILISKNDRRIALDVIDNIIKNYD
jgi:hypothetical protein